MKKIFFGSLFLMSVAIAYGQSGGEALKFSRYNFTQNTARSAAMAGAFTSLGADMSSMYINPAGLAMYSRSEVSITPSLFINNSVTNNAGLRNSNSTTKALVSNIGGVYADGNFTFGVGYNRVADFSGNYTTTGPAQNGSIGQVYMEQLAGINYKDISTPQVGDIYKPFFKYPPFLWNAIMAYQGELLNPVGDGSHYNMGGVFNYQDGDLVAPTTSIRTTGAMNEFTISGAYNIKNKVYIGLTLGIPHMYYDENYDYSEYASLDNTGSLDNFGTKQKLAIDGSGFNFKVGVTVRPVDWLRVGVAYHSPSWMRVRERSFNEFSLVHFNDTGYAYSDTPYLDNSYDMSTPSKLLAGISFTIAKIIIISADYERSWYRSMGYTSNINTYGLRMPNQFTIFDNYPTYVNNIDANGNVNLNAMIDNSYQTTNNFRVGVEVQPVNGLFVRAGYSYSQSPYAEKAYDMYDAQMLQDFGINSKTDLKKYGEIQQISAGLGYRNRGFGVDLTYVYGSYGELPTKNYYYNAPDVNDTVYNVQSPGYTVNHKYLHQIMATLLFKF